MVWAGSQTPAHLENSGCVNLLLPVRRVNACEVKSMKKLGSYTFWTIALTAYWLFGCSLYAPTGQIATSAVTQVPLPTSTGEGILPTAAADQCFGSRENLPVGVDGLFVLSGNYYLYRPGLELHRSPSYILMASTQNKIQLPQTENPETEDFVVSPDKKQVAYLVPDTDDMRNGRLLMIGNNGKLSKEYAVRGWFSVVGWINERRLLISKLAETYPFPAVIFDPVSGKEVELPPNYPDIHVGRPGLFTWDRYVTIETEYSPDLDFVVYPKTPNEIILWDIIAKKRIAVVIGRELRPQIRT